MQKRPVSLVMAAVWALGIAAAAAAPLPAAGETPANNRPAQYLVVFDQAWPEDAVTSVRKSGGRVTAVYPELHALLAATDSPRFADHMDVLGGSVYGPDPAYGSCPRVPTASGAAAASPSAPGQPSAGTAATESDAPRETRVRAQTLSELDADWSFQWDMQRLSGLPDEDAAAESGGPASTDQASGESPTESKPDEDAPLEGGASPDLEASPAAAVPMEGCGTGAAEAVTKAAESGARSLRLPGLKPAPGTADLELYRRALLFAAARHIRIDTAEPPPG